MALSRSWNSASPSHADQSLWRAALSHSDTESLLSFACLFACVCVCLLSHYPQVQQYLGCSRAHLLGNLRPSASHGTRRSPGLFSSLSGPRTLRSSAAPPLRTLIVIFSHSGARPLRSSTTLVLSPFNPVSCSGAQLLVWSGPWLLQSSPASALDRSCC